MQPLGMFAWFGYRLPLEQRLQLIAQAGFAMTCLWLGEEEELVAEGRADRMPLLARGAGLSVNNVHAPFADCNSLWADSAETVAALVHQYEDALAFCHEHNIPILVMHVAKGADPPPPTQAGLRAVKGLVSLAEKLDVVIAIENTRSTRHLDFALAKIDSPHLGFCYDSSHDFLNGQSMGKILVKWGHRLVTTHLADNNGIEDDHYLPGKGRIDWRMVRDRFPSSSYSKALMLEVVPEDPKSTTPKEFVQTAYTKALELGRSLSQQSQGGNANGHV